ncbi:hypothetical protein MKZ38_004372 [Zalerion maritima]|uniref:Uncharacterized protein n=1 Tax=Zalerion maritima TaxID=339359 RepID=A0AAD5RMG8_9PEZI|nr:hypothetical protein MKZ38_004372 [Zalerion maritima]
MTSIALSKNDVNVLEKIKDPESNPSCAAFIDPELARDPHIIDQGLYERLVQMERDILLSAQQVEMEIAELRPKSDKAPEMEYRACVESLDNMIEEFPQYASARNNRVQAMRRLYGDKILVPGKESPRNALLQNIDDVECTQAVTKILGDLDEAIRLLSPTTPFAGISPQQAKTLSKLHTQRAAVYHETSKATQEGLLRVGLERKESGWSRLQFEEAASRDFALGGKYGCDIAKGLAVSTNPTAKLCGQMVREAMKKEYGPGYGM